MDRKGFLKLGGISILGIGMLPALEVLTGKDSPAFSAAPGQGERRWAMVIDMRKCWEAGEECQDCILSCHRAHNVPDVKDAKEEIKWIWREPFEKVFCELSLKHGQEGLKGKPFLVLCNHCQNPPCVRVCPTQATFKRPDGTVAVDYHRCIGCRYCMAACPFGARSFNFCDPRPYLKDVNPNFPTREKGVVEKCNLCAERVDMGRPPVCVEACRRGALVFGDLNDPKSEVRSLLRSRFALRRRSELGTEPQVYYVID